MPTEARSPDYVPPSFADPSAGRIVLLADDLTGACDAGAAFLHAGRSVRVWFGTSVQFSTPESVQAFNTNSRALSLATRPAPSPKPHGSRPDPNSLFFKKVDSAASRPVRRRVARRASRPRTRAILFAPAFPATGRTVSDGVLEIEDACWKALASSPQQPLSNHVS